MLYLITIHGKAWDVDRDLQSRSYKGQIFERTEICNPSIFSTQNRFAQLRENGLQIRFEIECPLCFRPDCKSGLTRTREHPDQLDHKRHERVQLILKTRLLCACARHLRSSSTSFSRSGKFLMIIPQRMSSDTES
ncbi:hypothetical protein BH09BAC3_BH09BAC3_37340 [soil metagenome]